MKAANPNKPAMSAAGKMTLKMTADATGAAYQTVAAYAHKAGWTQKGKQTLLNEAQVTAIVEAMKRPASSGHKSNLLFQIEDKQLLAAVMLAFKMIKEGECRGFANYKAAKRCGFEFSEVARYTGAYAMPGAKKRVSESKAIT